MIVHRPARPMIAYRIQDELFGAEPPDGVELFARRFCGHVQGGYYPLLALRNSVTQAGIQEAMTSGLLRVFFCQLCDQARAWSRICSDDLTDEFYRDVVYRVRAQTYVQIIWGLYHIPRDLEAMCDLGQTWAAAAQGLLRLQNAPDGEPLDGGAFQHYSPEEEEMFRMQRELKRMQQMMEAARANPWVRHCEQNYRPAEPIGEEGEHADDAGAGSGEDIELPQQEDEMGIPAQEGPHPAQPDAPGFDDENDPEVQRAIFASIEKPANTTQLDEQQPHEVRVCVGALMLMSSLCPSPLLRIPLHIITICRYFLNITRT